MLVQSHPDFVAVPIAGANTSAWPWYAVRVKSNFEQVTAAALAGKGYETLLPIYRSRRQWSDRTKHIERPLFPGYVFCRFNASDRLPVLTCPGVVSILSFGGQPAIVQDSEIAAIQLLMASGCQIEPCDFLTVGHRVSIEAGPLRGLEGIVVEEKCTFRLVVSVTMLQRSVSAEVDRCWLRPLSETNKLYNRAMVAEN